MTVTRKAVDQNMQEANARESILASIRQNLAASRLYDDLHERANINDESARSASLSRDELINNFKRNLDLVGGHCYIVSDKSEAADTSFKIIDSLSGTNIAISDSPIVAAITNDLAVEAVVNADPAYLFASDVGITGAQYAIAETGTLVLESDAERHRLTSLVPPVHICILEAGNIRQTLGEILEIIQSDLSRTVTFITGASRTSDIELTLAIGVHGPRELHVVIIDDHRP
jgi:L-lactate dehydrogenase complex protein LldG